jgi:GT2 family glycosyltransferase
MNIARKNKIVLLGMMSKMPVAGVVWQTVHYLVGLRRLGCEVYYVEAHARTPSMFMTSERDDGSARAARFIAGVMNRFDLDGAWAFQALHDDGRCYGLSESRLQDLYRSADLIINLHGGTLPRPEHYATGRLVFLETDPVRLQMELHDGVREAIEFLAPHCAFFTFGENYSQPGCGLPVSDRFLFKPTRQPIVLDFWPQIANTPIESFTTVGNWRQCWGDVQFQGENYTWSKHHEFSRFLDLPGRTSQAFELALASFEEDDRRLLEAKGWRVRPALDFSMDLDAYRSYIAGSRGEFTVAKDQNVRLRTGWFSDRSATYLAAGRPVITQDTGFGDVLPTGEGLFAFSTMDEILEALESIGSDYARHRGAASELARECFDSDEVLGRLLRECGLERPPKDVQQVQGPALPLDLELRLVSRHPARLPEASFRAAMESCIPAATRAAATDRVEASIAVVTFNGVVFTRMCLASVLANTARPDYELIIVDNGSSDGTVEYLRAVSAAHAHVRLILNEGNRGFAAANNQALAEATGKVLVLLNNDTVVAPGWLEGLIRHLEDPRIGLVSPVTNRIGNEAEIETDYTTYGELLEFVCRNRRAHEGKLFDIATPCMFCLALRRDAYERIGPLDERFAVGMVEDDDYALRARSAGYRTVCVEDVFVHHFAQASFGNLVATGEYGRLLDANKRRLEEKWGRPWQPHARRPNAIYEELKERIRRAVLDATPPGATLLVVSRGDDDLLGLLQTEGRRVWHFPQAADGSYAGFYPADSEAAITHLEELRAKGAEYLLLPATALWWLDHYAQFGGWLDSRYRGISSDQSCLIHRLHPNEGRE